MATVELEISEDTWKKITTKALDKEYYECTVTINGEQLKPVAIRTKGASSLDDVKTMKSNRFSFTMKLNKYDKGQKYHGLSKLLLNNNIWDATQMNGTIPATWEAQKAQPQKLVNCDDINLQELGGI